MITETEIMNFMYLDCGMKNVETIITVKYATYAVSWGM